MIEQSLRTIILADSSVTDVLAADAVYPAFLPQGASKPAIVYEFDGPAGPLISGSTHAVDRYAVTLKVFSETYGAARDLTKALVSLLNGLSTTQGTDTIVSSRVLNVFSDFEDTLELHSAVIDITLHSTEN